MSRVVIIFALVASLVAGTSPSECGGDGSCANNDQANFIQRGVNAPIRPSYEAVKAEAKPQEAERMTADVHAVLAAETSGYQDSSPSCAKPPLYTVVASTLKEAGFKHGQQAKDRIHAWWDIEKAQQELFEWAQGPGKKQFAELKAHNTMLYPQYVEEMQGIAEGAGIELDKIWVVNMIRELTQMRTQPLTDHGSDAFAVSGGNFINGHNEDWPGKAKKVVYWVKYIAQGTSPMFNSCAGFCYPGQIVGFAMTWNPDGVFMSANSVWPDDFKSKGAVSTFAHREAICGEPGYRKQADVWKKLTEKEWSLGSSVNYVDLETGAMSNVETAGQDTSRHVVADDEQYEVAKFEASYSHFNGYKHLSPKGKALNPGRQGSLARQKRADELRRPMTRKDVLDFLSEDAFRPNTVLSYILDGKTKKMDIWCCGKKPNGGSGPDDTWDIDKFFSF